MNANDYKELYRSEAQEALLALENGLIAIESAAEPRPLIEELFRHAHNLKGISGAMGYEEIVEASHALENVLDALRRSGAVTVAKTGCMLGAVDILKKLVRCAVGGNAEEAATAENSQSVVLLSEALVLLSNMTDAPDQTVPVTQPASPTEAGGNEEERPHEVLGERITSTRVEIERLDRIMDLVGELTISRIRSGAIAGGLGSKPLIEELARSWRIISQIQKEIMEARLIPVGQVLRRFNRLVRDLAHDTGKTVRFEITGAEIGLDRVVLEGMVDPLVHLIRNAVDHGIEAPAERLAAGKPEEARVGVSARRDRTNVVIEVSDDGRGIDLGAVAEAAAVAGITKGARPRLTDEEVCRVLTTPGFSTSRTVDRLSGRGMGMSIVKKAVDSFGGTMQIRSTPGSGTTIALMLPINLSIIKALLFAIGSDVHALPIEYVKETNRFERGSLKTVRGDLVLPDGEGVVPLLMPDDVFGLPFEFADERYAKVIIVDTGEQRVGLVVSKIVGQQDIVIKALPPLFRGMRGVSGATILGSGKVAFIWDPHVFFEGRSSHESNEEALVLEN